MVGGKEMKERGKNDDDDDLNICMVLFLTTFFSCTEGVGE